MFFSNHLLIAIFRPTRFLAQQELVSGRPSRIATIKAPALVPDLARPTNTNAPFALFFG